MVDNSYYRNIGMDATAELNQRDEFENKINALIQDAGIQGQTDGEINEQIAGLLRNAYLDGEFKETPEQFAEKVSKMDFGYAGPVELTPEFLTFDDDLLQQEGGDPNAPTREEMVEASRQGELKFQGNRINENAYGARADLTKARKGMGNLTLNNRVLKQ